MVSHKCNDSYRIDEKQKEKMYQSLKQTFKVYNDCEPYKGWILPDGSIIGMNDHFNILDALPEVLDDVNPNWKSELIKEERKKIPISYVYVAYNVGKSGLNMIRMMKGSGMAIDINKDTEITTQQLNTVQKCIKEIEDSDEEIHNYYVSVKEPKKRKRTEYPIGSIGYENWHPINAFDEKRKEKSITVDSDDRPSNKIISFLIKQTEKGCSKTSNNEL